MTADPAARPTAAHPRPAAGSQRPAGPSPAATWAIAAGIVAVLAFVRLVWFPSTFLPIAYGMPLVLNLWLRNRATLWAMTAAFVLIAALKNLLLLPPGSIDMLHRVEALGLIAFDTLVIAAVVDAFLVVRVAAERRQADLLAAVEELAAREEEIARQNEELQSQAEELEGQSEELRVGNDELARRERTLQTLLTLSRGLAAGQSRQETLERVCDALAAMVDDAEAGVVVFEAEGDELVVRCGRGVAGPACAAAPAAGPAPLRVPAPRSFAALVLGHGRTGYIEDMSLRPDLLLPPAADGSSFRSVLSTPLRVGGRAVGTIEILGRRRQAFADEQVAMIESVAAQASVSLEAATLFERVAAERQRLQVVLQTLPVAVLIADDPAGAEMRGNAALADLYRVARDTNFSPVTPAAAGGLRRTFSRDGVPLAVHELPLIRAMRTGRPVCGEEFQITVGDGPTVTVLMSAAPFFDDRGAVTGGVGALVDVTSRKQLQQELDARRREAEEASVRKTRFLAAISHDIRTPANAMSLLAELIRRAASNPAMVGDLPELAQELHGSATALVNLLGDVLDLARFDSGRIELQETEFALGDLLAEHQRRLQPLARDKGLDLHVGVPEGDGLRVRCDRIKLGRIVDNLVGNAIKFTRAGHVRVEAERTPGRATRIRVIDTGIGIDPDDQRHIFDEFFQLANPERDRTKGTGLGLTICKRLVDAMGGELHVQSAPDAGSTFTLTLSPSACA